MSGPAGPGEPRGRRERLRAAGLDPDYWYAVEYDRAVKPGQVVEVAFWGESIALYRGTDGRLRALENRCAHRQLKLSLGDVTGCGLTCAYHGWSYAEDGRLAAIPLRRCPRRCASRSPRSRPCFRSTSSASLRRAGR